MRPLPLKIFRWLCLLTALANAGGNAALYLVYEPVFAWLSVPQPADPFAFAATTGFSFTIGVLAFAIYLRPQESISALVGCALAKGLYAFVTLYMFVFADLHWFWLIFGVWDAVYTVIFLLFLAQLVKPDLTALNTTGIRMGSAKPRTNKALLLGFSLTKNVDKGLARVSQGLEAGGYEVTTEMAVPVESELFAWPLTVARFVRISVRAVLRRPAKIHRLSAKADDGYDLIVVASQTWLAGMSAVVEGIFEDPDNRGLFEGTDVASLTICRGLWRRTQAMTVDWVERSGGHMVAVRHALHVGREPFRFFSLMLYLVFGKVTRPRLFHRFWPKKYGLSDADLDELEVFGHALAVRDRLPPIEQSITGGNEHAL